MRYKLLTAALLLSALLLLTSCSKGKHCTLTINASFDGFSIAGEPLGSGSYEESFTVPFKKVFSRRVPVPSC